MLNRNHQLISGGKFQWIWGVTSILDWLGIAIAAATAVPLATDKLVTLAREKNAKFIAKIILEVYQTGIGIDAFGS